MKTENWKPIVIPESPEYDGVYEVSDMGSIRRAIDGVNTVAGRILKKKKTRLGYVRVQLNNNGKSAMKSMHRLVAYAFIPNPNGLPQVNHKNGIKEDNRVENLEWVTASENKKHSYRVLGKTGMIGTRHPLCRLSESDVIQIRNWWKTGDVTQSALAAVWGVDQAHISAIVLRKFWKHVA